MSRVASGKMERAGLAALMDQQALLLDELMAEMGNKGPRQQKEDQVLQVVRNMEDRLNEVKWPARANQRMDELDSMIARIDPSVAERRPQQQQVVGRRSPLENLSSYQPQQGHGSGHHHVDAIDALDNELTASAAVGRHRDSMDHALMAEERSRERRLREQKRRRKEREIKKELKQREKEEEMLNMPDPSVLAHIFNPFRLKEWHIPPVEKYQHEIEELQKERLEIERERLEQEKIAKEKAASSNRGIYDPYKGLKNSSGRVRSSKRKGSEARIDKSRKKDKDRGKSKDKKKQQKRDLPKPVIRNSAEAAQLDEEEELEEEKPKSVSKRDKPSSKKIKKGGAADEPSDYQEVIKNTGKEKSKSPAKKVRASPVDDDEDAGMDDDGVEEMDPIKEMDEREEGTAGNGRGEKSRASKVLSKLGSKEGSKVGSKVGSRASKVVSGP